MKQSNILFGEVFMMKPELLSPCSGPDSLGAALRGGADAVYFGGAKFNARMNAKNFDDEGIRRAVHACHEKGVRAYVTLNTLLFDKNISPALEFTAYLYEAGVDALILADLGFSRLVHQNFPDFEIHASTQMTGVNVPSARFLQNLGFSRMVCPREMTKEELFYLCKNSPIEIEMFVHGAICASVSGQCLMSSMIGNRSGNRGECAQPCRLPYNNSYPLSFKDLCLAGHMKEILSFGVSSLKIEGRMKSPAYIYAVTRAYRTLIDEKRSATPSEIDRLARVFSRSGFTDGYYENRRNSAMLGIRREADKESSGREKTSFSDSGRVRPAIKTPERKAEFSLPEKPKRGKAGGFSTTARFYKPESVPDTDFFDLIFLPVDRFDPKKAKGVFLPPVTSDRSLSELKEKLLNVKRRGAEAVLVQNIGQLAVAEQSGLKIYGDFRLNTTNAFSKKLFLDSFNMEEIILSPELNLAQNRDLTEKGSVIVYGRLPLMLLRKKVPFEKLRDRRGVSFPVIEENSMSLVLNSVPTYMADKKKALREYSIFRRHFIFTTENKSEVLRVINAYQNGTPTDKPARRIK